VSIATTTTSPWLSSRTERRVDHNERIRHVGMMAPYVISTSGESYSRAGFERATDGDVLVVVTQRCRAGSKGEMDKLVSGPVRTDRDAPATECVVPTILRAGFRQ
jgi:hypothetical protein